MLTSPAPLLRSLCAIALLFLLASCATRDTRHHMVVSVPEQRLAVVDKERGAVLATYPISTSKFALSDQPGSRGTPLGELEVAQKIGTGAPAGAVFKSRRRTGEILAPDSPGRDPIVSRILWLRGLEPQNRNAYGRYIYIHGTAEERMIGQPASYGCVRMRSRDVIDLYNIVGNGARVSIVTAPLAAVVPQLTAPARAVASTDTTLATSAGGDEPSSR
jgi:lipoprotein-anchoring transpeptidase ErfK/SrfK